MKLVYLISGIPLSQDVIQNIHSCVPCYNLFPLNVQVYWFQTRKESQLRPQVKSLQTNGTLHGYKMTYCSRHLQSIFLLFRRIHKCLLDGIYSFHCSPVTAIAHVLRKWKGFLTLFLICSTWGDGPLLGSIFSCHTLSRSLL